MYDDDDRKRFQLMIRKNFAALVSDAGIRLRLSQYANTETDDLSALLDIKDRHYKLVESLRCLVGRLERKISNDEDIKFLTELKAALRDE